MRKSLIAIVATVFALSVLAIYAESADRLIESNVPFAFQVDQKYFPAGKYMAERLSSADNEWIIRSNDGRHEAMFLTEHTESLDPAKVSALLFEEVGGQHYLSGIQIAGNTEGWTLDLSKVDLSTMDHTTRQVPGVLRRHS